MLPHACFVHLYKHREAETHEQVVSLLHWINNIAYREHVNHLRLSVLDYYCGKFICWAKIPNHLFGGSDSVFWKTKPNQSVSARAKSRSTLPESECCSITVKRLQPQIQQFHICSLCVECVPTVNRTISCNSSPLVSRWLMPKQQTF